MALLAGWVAGVGPRHGRGLDWVRARAARWNLLVWVQYCLSKQRSEAKLTLAPRLDMSIAALVRVAAALRPHEAVANQGPLCYVMLC